MKPIIFGVFILMAFNGLAQGSLKVEILNVRSSKGNVRVGLFHEEKFLEEAVFGKVAKAANGSVIVQFDSLPVGEYALSVVHDENANGKLDSNSIGIPTEGFGFGNNAMGFFGPPSFEKAKIKIEEKNQANQSIKVKYL